MEFSVSILVKYLNVVQPIMHGALLGRLDLKNMIKHLICLCIKLLQMPEIYTLDLLAVVYIFCRNCF